MPNYKHLTPDQHYIEAERVIANAREASHPDYIRALLMEAQIHATLANFTPKGDKVIVSRNGQMDTDGWACCNHPLNQMSHSARAHLNINPEEWS